MVRAGVVRATGSKQGFFGNPVVSAASEFMKLPDVYNRLVERGAEPVSAPSEDLRKLLAYEIAKWSKVIREIGIQPH